MSIVRLYRDRVGDDGARLFEYREAWADAEAGEFVVHHGRVGQPGTVGEQPLADQAEGDQLLAAFVAQGAEEGFAEADPATFAVLPVAYRLRGREATVIERRTVERLRVEVTHQLAWRGLGEVEDVVAEHPAVGQVGVIGVPDDKWGEAVTAIVVLRNDADADDAAKDRITAEIQQSVKDRKGAVQSPKRVIFADALPLTALGKPDKKALRSQYWADSDRGVG